MTEIDLEQFKGHTPGPLHVTADKQGRCSIRRADGISLAETNALDENDQSETANAAIFAAAPALLAHNQQKEKEIARLRQQLVTDQAEIDRLRRDYTALIDKAENLVIAVGMGWDLGGAVAEMRKLLPD